MLQNVNVQKIHSPSQEKFSIFLDLLAVGLEKVLKSFPKFIVFPVPSSLGFAVFSFDEAV